MNQLYIYIYPHISSLLHLPPSYPPYPTPLGGHKAPSWSPCAMWLLSISYWFYNFFMFLFLNINGKSRIIKYLKNKIWHEIESKINKWKTVSKEIEIFKNGGETHKNPFINILRDMWADTASTVQQDAIKKGRFIEQEWDLDD